jgi:hypothetical protein
MILQAQRNDNEFCNFSTLQVERIYHFETEEEVLRDYGNEISGNHIYGGIHILRERRDGKYTHNENLLKLYPLLKNSFSRHFGYYEIKLTKILEILKHYQTIYIYHVEETKMNTYIYIYKDPL